MTPSSVTPIAVLHIIGVLRIMLRIMLRIKMKRIIRITQITQNVNIAEQKLPKKNMARFIT